MLWVALMLDVLLGAGMAPRLAVASSPQRSYSYGNPNTGPCVGDDGLPAEVVSLQDVAGHFCSPQGSGQSGCPKDLPPGTGKVTFACLKQHSGSNKWSGVGCAMIGTVFCALRCQTQGGGARPVPRVNRGTTTATKRWKACARIRPLHQRHHPIQQHHHHHQRQHHQRRCVPRIATTHGSLRYRPCPRSTLGRRRRRWRRWQ